MSTKSLNSHSNKRLNMFEKLFSKFITFTLGILFFILIIASTGTAFAHKNLNYVNVSIITLYIILIFSFMYGIKKELSKGKMLFFIILAGLLLRIGWAIITPSRPTSDFEVMFKSAEQFLNGNYSSFKDLGYFARFPHMIPYIMFVSFVDKYAGTNNLLVVKCFNIFLSTFSIFLVYIICKSIFKDYKRSLIGGFMMAILPSSILYVSVYCSENIAIPFYLASIYFFILVFQNKKSCLYLLLCGLFLSVGHLFRMIAYIVIIAYIMYILIYNNEKLILKLKNILLILIPFVSLYVLSSNILLSNKITDRPLWSGAEPSITSAVRGSNIKSGGSWNPEDAEFISNHLSNRDELAKASKAIIIERYSNMTPSEITKFMLTKFVSQWASGDSSGAYWSQLQIPEEDIKFDVSGKGIFAFQIIFSAFLVFILVGIFNRSEQKKNPIINLFYIILCGFGVIFLILETQCRYAYIVSFLFAIMPIMAFEPYELKKSIKQ